jgi:hypothetical protein
LGEVALHGAGWQVPATQVKPTAHWPLGKLALQGPGRHWLLTHTSLAGHAPPG